MQFIWSHREPATDLYSESGMLFVKGTQRRAGREGGMRGGNPVS